jgi:dipeptidyl aminopeptidase/acylaminoacyl peptidase
LKNFALSILLIILLCLCGATLRASGAALAVNEPTPSAALGNDQFSIEDSLRLRSLTWLESPALSPDSQYVVYMVSYLGPESRHDGKHQEMWLLEIKTKQTALITDEAWECSKPTWSPDGKRVAFYDKVGSGTGIKVWSLETRSLRLIASDIERGDLVPWSPDGQFIFAKRTAEPSTALSPTDKTGSSTKDGVTVYRSVENADKAATETSKDVESSILAIDSSNGMEKTLVRRKKMEYFAVSPNGKFIAWYENGRFFSKPEFYRLGDIGIVNLSTGAVQIVVHDFRDLFNMYGNAFSWSPDGNTFGVARLPIEARGNSSTYSVVDARTGVIRPVYTSQHPQDDLRISFIQWVNEKQFVVREGANGRELWLVSIDGRKPHCVYEGTSGTMSDIVLGV